MSKQLQVKTLSSTLTNLLCVNGPLDERRLVRSRMSCESQLHGSLPERTAQHLVVFGITPATLVSVSLLIPDNLEIAQKIADDVAHRNTKQERKAHAQKKAQVLRIAGLY